MGPDTTQQTSNPVAASVDGAAIQPAKTLPTPVEFLSQINLGQYESTLAELGATRVDDYKDFADEDLRQAGMKPLEVKRFMRVAAEL